MSESKTKKLSELEVIKQAYEKNKNKIKKELTVETIKKYQQEGSWRNIRTRKMTYEEAIEACIRSEEEGVQAAINLFKPRCDERADLFIPFDKYFHLKMAYEMSYKQVFKYNNFNVAPFALNRFSTTVKQAFTEHTINAYIESVKSEYKPYTDKKGRTVSMKEHIDKNLKKLRSGFKLRVFKTVKAAGMLFVAAKYIKNARTLGIKVDLQDFIKRLNVIEHFEHPIVALRKQKCLFNLIDLARASEYKINKKVDLPEYTLYDEFSKGQTINEHRHKPQYSLRIAMQNFEKRTNVLFGMKEKIDASKFRR